MKKNIFTILKENISNLFGVEKEEKEFYKPTEDEIKKHFHRPILEDMWKLNRGEWRNNKDLLYKMKKYKLDLSNAQLGYSDLKGANLSYANLTNAFINHCDLTNADLSNANLTNTTLYRSDLTDACLSNVKVDHTNLEEADLDNTDLTNVNLANCYIDAKFRI